LKVNRINRPLSCTGKAAYPVSTMKKYDDRMNELPSSLHEERLAAVIGVLRSSGAESVLDLGCGAGELLRRLAGEPQFKRMVGLETSQEALAAARQLLWLDRETRQRRIGLYYGSFTSFMEELADFDAAVLLETIEHIPPNRLSLVEKAIFAGYRPETVIVTTPNLEYNPLHGIPQGMFRHQDHKFEWTRVKFRKWAEGTARRNGYTVAIEAIGAADPQFGSSTQMAVFSGL
jgi:3' terminal RNA ribose 2'-O-methyltransferase Hen1